MKDPKAQISFTQSPYSEWKIFVNDLIYGSSIFDETLTEAFLDPGNAFIQMPEKVYDNFVTALIKQNPSISY